MGYLLYCRDIKIKRRENKFLLFFNFWLKGHFAKVSTQKIILLLILFPRVRNVYWLYIWVAIYYFLLWWLCWPDMFQKKKFHRPNFEISATKMADWVLELIFFVFGVVADVMICYFIVLLLFNKLWQWRCILIAA